MNDDLAQKLIAELFQVRIAIGGTNPDPQQTIQGYRDMRAAQQAAADQLVIATRALARATWALFIVGGATVGLTVVQILIALKVIAR